jgi:hypothetical protein
MRIDEWAPLIASMTGWSPDEDGVSKCPMMAGVDGAGSLALVA